MLDFYMSYQDGRQEREDGNKQQHAWPEGSWTVIEKDKKIEPAMAAMMTTVYTKHCADSDLHT